jgi:hypothetical protein
MSPYFWNGCIIKKTSHFWEVSACTGRTGVSLLHQSFWLPSTAWYPHALLTITHHTSWNLSMHLYTNHWVLAIIQPRHAGILIHKYPSTNPNSVGIFCLKEWNWNRRKSCQRTKVYCSNKMCPYNPKISQMKSSFPQGSHHGWSRTWNLHFSNPASRDNGATCLSGPFSCAHWFTDIVDGFSALDEVKTS